MKPNEINILVACEESQRICTAFRDAGFTAYSADLQRVKSTAHPEWHIPGDVTPLLKGCTQFTTQNDTQVDVGRWHMIIAHPPCTYLCKVSSVRMTHNGQIDESRYAKMLQAREFFMLCLESCAQFVAVENPLPMARAELPKPDCFIQPYWFGERYSKKTLFWLKNLPPLMPGIINPNFREFVRSSRGKYRSRTFPGVAQAIVDQWGSYVLDELNTP